MKPTQSCSRFAKTCGPSAAMSARRAVLRRIQRQELRKLQSLLPTSLNRSRCRVSDNPDACQVIEDAVRYIDQLHATVLARVRAGTLPQEVVGRLNLQAVCGGRDCLPANRSGVEAPVAAATAPGRRQRSSLKEDLLLLD